MSSLMMEGSKLKFLQQSSGTAHEHDRELHVIVPHNTCISVGTHMAAQSSFDCFGAGAVQDEREAVSGINE